MDARPSAAAPTARRLDHLQCSDHIRWVYERRSIRAETLLAVYQRADEATMRRCEKGSPGATAVAFRVSGSAIRPFEE